METQPLISASHDVRADQERKHRRCKLKVIIPLLVICLIFIITMAVTQSLKHSSKHDASSWVEIDTIKVPPKQWAWHSDVEQSTSITLTFALKQQNVEKLHDELMAVSDPTSDDYGNHWSYSQVHDYLQPSEESKAAVKAWLVDHGVAAEDIEDITPNGDFISVETTIGKANKLLHAQYGYWEHAKTGNKHIRVKDKYFVPEDVSQHLDFVSPTLRFPANAHTRQMQQIVSSAEFTSAADIIANGNIESDSSYNYIFPSTLKSLYNVEVSGGNSDSNSQAVASFLEEWYTKSDVEQFWELLDVDTCTLTNVPETQPSGYGSEAELDVQYITSMGEKVNTIVWDIEDDLYFISLLKQIDSDDYPTPYVVSMSYGGDEDGYGSSYLVRANVEFAKVGLLGITFFASSGDSGALSSDDTCSDTNSYVATFPASSPYVTAVGGVTGGVTYEGGTSTVIDSDSSESAWLDGGGGFSTYFKAKSFQSSAVSDYLTTNADNLDTSKFDSEGAGYPDLAAQSEYFVVCDGGSYWAVSGTSASCPTVAGMFALINDARLAAGKSTLGYLNPMLYHLYDSDDSSDYFNDIVDGYNLGCESDDYVGYEAVEGWDAATGLGSLNFANVYEKLVNYK